MFIRRVWISRTGDDQLDVSHVVTDATILLSFFCVGSAALAADDYGQDDAEDEEEAGEVKC